MTTLATYPHFALSPEASVLHRIRETDLNLAVWRRTPPPRLAEFLDQLASTHLLIDLIATNPKSTDAALASHPALKPFLADPRLHLWIDDLLQLTNLFAQISGSPAVRLRLETVRGEDCAVFHEDAVGLRLLCTYRGPGTQWLEEENCRREELGLRGRSLAEANNAIVIDPSYIRPISTWSVALLKGRTYPGNPTGGVIHRSYPVSSAAETRIRLCLDVA